MEFERSLANVLANGAIGWYTNSLTNAEFADVIERALESHEQTDLRLPPEITAEILARHGQESGSV